MKSDDVNRLIDQRKALAQEALDEMVAENQRLGLYDDAVNMTQECVDKTAKDKHEWVGLTVNEVLELLPSSKWKAEETLLFVQRIEDELKEKNT